MPFAIITAFCKKCDKYKRIGEIKLSILEDFWKFTLSCGHGFRIKNEKKIEWND